MKEIKFRAWNKESNTMVDLEEITPLALSSSMNTQLRLRGCSGLFIPFDKELPIMQYTGLKDKDGIEIYESDILEFDPKEWAGNLKGKNARLQGHRFIIRWDNDEAGFMGDGTHHDWGEWCHVVGNIHENPELLGAKSFTPEPPAPKSAPDVTITKE